MIISDQLYQRLTDTLYRAESSLAVLHDWDDGEPDRIHRVGQSVNIPGGAVIVHHNPTKLEYVRQGTVVDIRDPKNVDALQLVLTALPKILAQNVPGYIEYSNALSAVAEANSALSILNGYMYP